MRINEIIKNMRNQRKLEKGMNWLKKKALFDQTKLLTEDLMADQQIYDKKSLIYCHSFLANDEVTLITELLIEQAKETIRTALKKQSDSQ